MTGIHYLTDEAGERIAVQLDLRIHSELWEELEDALISESRLKEERIPLEEVKARLIEVGRLRG